MSIFVEKNGKKLVSRSIYVKILIFIGLITLSAIAMRPLQLALSEAMANFRNNLIEKLENYTGMEIRYSSIRPAFFNSFDIRGLKLLKNENEILTVSRTRFRFSLFDLLFRKKITVSFVQIDRPALHIDMDRDREIIELIKSLPDNSA
ncbi:MAG: hypothetical protein LBI12_07685, partial [Treponema sp.]|nr:hypothetical protein [Treponema sp.]